MKRLVMSCVLVWGVWGMTGCRKEAKPPQRKATSRKAPQKRAVKQGTSWEAKIKAEGVKVAKASFLVLAGKLMAALKDGGIKKAIGFCATNAQALTKDLSKKYKVQIQRVSHKARNPKNQANAEEMKLITRYLAARKAKKPLKPTVQKVSDKEFLFYGPIVLGNPLCLQCHGTEGKLLTKENAALIRKHYPKDQATGFAMGQLRGMWKIRFTQP